MASPGSDNAELAALDRRIALRPHSGAYKLDKAVTLAREDRKRVADTTGIVSRLAAQLESCVSEMPSEGLEALAIQEPGMGRELRVILLVESYAKEMLDRRFRARCGLVAGGTEIVTMTFAEVAQGLVAPLELHCWVSLSSPLYGEQRFWETVLASDNGREFSSVG